MAKIVGHRGAAGLVLENTLASIREARKYGVDAIEFDVRRTKDNHLVLCHDEHLARISVFDTVLAEVDLEDISTVTLHDDHAVPSLREALRACGDIPVMLEIKDTGIAKDVVKVIHEFKDKHISITTFLRSEAKAVRKADQSIPVFVAEHTSPLEVIATARSIGAAGVTLNAGIMNPLTYWLARRYKLKVMVYTVNNKFVAGFLRSFYPRIMICTDRPDKFVRKRRLKKLARKLQAKTHRAARARRTKLPRKS